MSINYPEDNVENKDTSTPVLQVAFLEAETVKDAGDFCLTIIICPVELNNLYCKYLHSSLISEISSSVLLTSLNLGRTNNDVQEFYVSTVCTGLGFGTVAAGPKLIRNQNRSQQTRASEDHS